MHHAIVSVALCGPRLRQPITAILGQRHRQPACLSKEWSGRHRCLSAFGGFLLCHNSPRKPKGHPKQISQLFGVGGCCVSLVCHQVSSNSWCAPTTCVDYNNHRLTGHPEQAFITLCVSLTSCAINAACFFFLPCSCDIFMFVVRPGKHFLVCTRLRFHKSHSRSLG